MAQINIDDCYSQMMDVVVAFDVEKMIEDGYYDGITDIINELSFCMRTSKSIQDFIQRIKIKSKRKDIGSILYTGYRIIRDLGNII